MPGEFFTEEAPQEFAVDIAAVGRTARAGRMTLAQLRERLSRLKSLVGQQALSRVKPEFGAYMYYSWWQEVGNKWTRKSGNFRPHILPAVLNNASEILRVLAQYYLDTTAEIMRSTGAVPQEKIVAGYAKAWTRALNDKPRREAVVNAPKKYGFHRRSIYGYAYARTDDEIRAFQEQQRAARKVKETAAQFKSRIKSARATARRTSK